jgi:D-glycero-alpha-D-manno-heptose-7-phosphate kinase
MIKYLFRSKSPLRIGLAGGGTDVSPYSDEYGGAILNATINYYAYASIEIDALRLNNGWNHYQQNVDGNRLQKKIKLEIKAEDQNTYMTFALDEIKPLPVAKELPMHIGVFNRIVRDYPQERRYRGGV